VSGLLRAWSQGDSHALDELIPVVYHELHRLARNYMNRERAGHSLQATALVHEAYIRLVDYKRMQWQDRAHFFAAHMPFPIAARLALSPLWPLRKLFPQTPPYSLTVRAR